MKRDITRLFCLVDDFLKALEEKKGKRSKSKTDKRKETRRELRD